MASRSKQKGKRKKIVAARGSVCARCNHVGYVELHHVHALADGGGWTDDNLVLLCRKCHVIAHGGRPKQSRTDDVIRLYEKAGYYNA